MRNPFVTYTKPETWWIDPWPLIWLMVIINFGMMIGGAIHMNTVDHEHFRTTKKITPTWELRAHGQTVDTVWIYNIK